MPQTSPATKLGMLIRDARKAAHMKQWELGVAAGVAERSAGQAISDWERGRNAPEAVRMAKIIVATNMDVSAAWRAWGEAQIRDGDAEEIYFAATSPGGEAASAGAPDREDQIGAGLAKAEGLDRPTPKTRRSRRAG